MIYTFILIDKPQQTELRQRVRPEHKAYLAAMADRIAFAIVMCHNLFITTGQCLLCTCLAFGRIFSKPEDELPFSVGVTQGG